MIATSRFGSIMSDRKPITDRTEQFAIRVIKACSFLDEQHGVARTVSKQLLRSGTSILARNTH